MIGPSHGNRLGVIIPTYLRDGPLRRTLQRLAEQSVIPVEVAVVDNANARGCRQLCSEMAPIVPYVLTYLASPTNGGPAAASSIGIQHFLAGARTVDWIVRGDDDSPVVDLDLFERLCQAAASAQSRPGRLGGIGVSGAVYSRRSGQLSKPPNAPLKLVPVDYLATNFFPLFSVEAAREVGGFRDELFFGHDEVDFGLRVRAAGFELLRFDPPGERHPLMPSRALVHPTWRRYYGLRNQIVVARTHGSRLAAPRLAIISLVKPLLNFPRSPRLAVANLQCALRAVVDAYLGRLGRTVEPSVVGGELDFR